MKAMFFVAAQSAETSKCINRCIRATCQQDARARFYAGLRFYSDKSFEVYAVNFASEQQIHGHFARLVDLGTMSAEYANERIAACLTENSRYLQAVPSRVA